MYIIGYLLVLPFYSIFSLLSCAYAWDTGPTISLIRAEHQSVSCKPGSEVHIDKQQYECVVKENIVYGVDSESNNLIEKKQSVYYWVSNKIQLDNRAFKEAKILVTVEDSISGVTSAMGLDELPVPIDEVREAAYPVRAFRVRISLNDSGRRKLEHLKKTNAGRELAVLFEGKLVEVVLIGEKMTTDAIVVDHLTFPEAKRLEESIDEEGAA